MAFFICICICSKNRYEYSYSWQIFAANTNKLDIVSSHKWCTAILGSKGGQESSLPVTILYGVSQILISLVKIRSNLGISPLGGWNPRLTTQFNVVTVSGRPKRSNSVAILQVLLTNIRLGIT